jgi:hypothetical protein
VRFHRPRLADKTAEMHCKIILASSRTRTAWFYLQKIKITNCFKDLLKMTAIQKVFCDLFAVITEQNFNQTKFL